MVSTSSTTRTHKLDHPSAYGGPVTRLPGDDVLSQAGLVMDRHLALVAPPDEVWPWLEQLGKHRAGWYLPHSVERLVPVRRRGARRIDERWLGLEVGDVVPDWGPGTRRSRSSSSPRPITSSTGPNDPAVRDAA